MNVRTTFNLQRCFPLIVFVALVSGISPAQCTPPPTFPIGFSWEPNAQVQVNNISGSVPGGPLGTALTNWDTGLQTQFNCNQPSFSTASASPNAFVNISYVAAIPQQCLASNQVDVEMVSSGTPVTRGCTDVNNAQFDPNGRFQTVNMYISTVVTATAAITEVIAHEFGHTLALADCDATQNSNCKPGSSVMVSRAIGAGGTVNSLEGKPGPTPCDLASVAQVDTDYPCSGGGGSGGDCAFVPGPTGQLQTTDPGGDPPPCNCPPGQTCIGPGTGSPIIIDTEGEGFHLTSAVKGVSFDIRGTGNAVQMAWTDSRFHNAFLALPGPDGLVHNGKELFGNFTPQPQSPHPNGFLALAEYDKPEKGGNADGVIDDRDEIFSRLRLWIDDNHDGICQPNELHPLPEFGVYSLALSYAESRRTDKFGNQFRYKARLNPGQRRDARDETPSGDPGRWTYDVFFVIK